MSSILKNTRFLLQKKPQLPNFNTGGMNKMGSDEKWAQSAMEYIYERNHVNDSRKGINDILKERYLANAFDQYTLVNHCTFSCRIANLQRRMEEALNCIHEKDLKEEALLLNSEQPPLSYRRPSLTPPISGYEPGYGLDVPQLQNSQMEYPAKRHTTDIIEGQLMLSSDVNEDFSEESTTVPLFPAIDTLEIQKLIQTEIDKIKINRNVVRQQACMTGPTSEAWEASLALEIKALSRQQLILELIFDNEFRVKYDSNESFREEELKKRGIVRLIQEDPIEGISEPEIVAPFRFSVQTPYYVPFRNF